MNTDTKARPYSEAQLDKIRRALEFQTEQGEEVSYEVWVDGVRVIYRTEDTELFGNIEDFLDDETELLSIRVFKGKAHRSIPHEFYFSDQPPQTSQALSGAKVDQMIAEALQRDRDQRELEMLREEITKYMEENDQWEKDYEELKAKYLDLKGKSLGDVNLLQAAGQLFGGYVQSTPNALGTSGVGQMLAGLAGSAAQPEAETQSEDHGEVEFESVEESADSQYLTLLRAMREGFSEEQFLQVMAIVEALSTQPEKIPEVAALLQYDQSLQSQSHADF